MKITHFDPTADLIIFPAGSGDRVGKVRLNLVLDTGAAETVVIPDVLDELGYSAREGDKITVMRSVVGREQGYLIRVACFACLGFQLSDFQIHAHDLPEGWGIHGLVGLSFLRQLNYEIRSLEGRLLVERAAA